MARWSVEWLVKTEGSARTVPAFEFLRQQPPTVRAQLLAIVDAVRTPGPDRWRNRVSHDSMRSACTHQTNSLGHPLANDKDRLPATFAQQPQNGGFLRAFEASQNRGDQFKLA